MRPLARTVMPLVVLVAAGAARGGTIHVPQDQPTIQAGVLAANPGDTVLISAGTYPEEVIVLNAFGLTLKGKGQVVVDALGDLPAVEVADSSDVHLLGLRFTDGAGDGVTISGSSLVTLTDCRFDGFVHDGVSSDDSSNVVVDHCTFTGIDGTAVALPADGATPGDEWLVTHCTIKDMPPTSVAMSLAGKDGRVEDSHVVGVPGGIVFGDVFSTGGSVTGNHLVDTGLEVNAAGATVAGNSLLRSPMELRGEGDIAQDNVCKHSGLAVFGADAVSITANHVALADPANAVGVSVAIAGDAHVTGNVITGHSLLGIEFLNCINAQADDNHVAGAGAAGVEIENSSNVAIGHSALKGCGIGLWLLSTSPFATIDANHVTGSHGDGLRIDGTNASITANVVHGSHASGLHLGSQSADCTVSANVVHGSHDFDLFDESGGANTITNDNDFGTQSP